MEKHKPYLITFYDHSIDYSNDNNPDPITCNAIGYLRATYKLCYRFSYWDIIDDDYLTRIQNRETFKILKSDIISIKEIFIPWLKS